MRALEPPRRAVVSDEGPGSEVRSGRTGDLHELAGVVALVIVVDLVDPNRAAGRSRRVIRG